MIGIVAPEFQLSANALGEFAQDIDIAALTTGKVAVVYTNTNLTGFVRIFDPETGTSSAALTINPRDVDPAAGNSSTRDIWVTGTPGGGFAVVATLTTGQYLWTFNADGAVQVNGRSMPTMPSDLSTLHSTSRGFLATYETDLGATSKGMGRFFNTDGSPAGRAFEIAPDFRHEMEAVELANGRMAVVYTNGSAVEVKQFSTRGTQVGPTTVIDSNAPIPGTYPMGPKIIADGKGFLTLHIDNGALVLTRLNAANAIVGTPVTVLDAYPGTGPYTGYLKPDNLDAVHDFAVLRSGVIVVAWHGYENDSASGGTNIFISFHAPNGAPLGEPIVANVRVPDDQMGVDLVALPDGRLLLGFLDDTNVLFGAQQSVRGAIIEGPDGYFSGTTDNDFARGGAGDDLMAGAEGNDTLYGARGDDLLLGGIGNDSLRGDSGKDQLNGGDGDDVLLGGSGNDVIYGGTGNDTALGEPGEDMLLGEGGNDSLQGGDWNDALFGGSGNDTLNGGEDMDALNGDEGDDRLLGDAANDIIYGGIGNDTAFGGSGNDNVEGGDGNDNLSGGSGSDALYGGRNNDKLSGDAAADILNGGDGNDALFGGEGNDTLVGARDNDRLLGEGGNDSMLGGLGDDTLTGGGGADYLAGGSGNDVLNGGSGNDVFVFNRFWMEDDSNGADIVVGFTVGVDRLDFTGWNHILGDSLVVSASGDRDTLLTSDEGTVLLRGVAFTSFDVADILI